jgi:hypothetical protein
MVDRIFWFLKETQPPNPSGLVNLTIPAELKHRYEAPHQGQSVFNMGKSMFRTDESITVVFSSVARTLRVRKLGTQCAGYVSCDSY